MKNESKTKKIHETAERIEELRIEKGFKSMRGWCADIKFPYGSYSHCVNRSEKSRATAPSLDLLTAIHRRFPEVNIHYLVTGEGEKEILQEEDRMIREDEIKQIRAEQNEIKDLAKMLTKQCARIQDESDELAAVNKKLRKENVKLKEQIH